VSAGLGLKFVLRGFVVAAVALLLSGCSAMKLAYENADTYLMWRGGQYFEFRGAAKEEYARRVQKFLAWHRRIALPQYAALADEAAARLARGLSQADLSWGYDAFQVQVRAGLRAAAAETAELLDALEPAQIASLERRLADDNRKFAKDYGLAKPAGERRKRRVERNVERMEDWLGTVSDEQLERIKLYAARAPLDEEGRDRERRRLQRELVLMLRAGEARARLAEWAVNWEQRREPEYEKARRAHREEYQGMLLDLDRTLTAAQRAHAVKRLRDFAADFRLLAAGG
jgi:hypothetical protein